MTKLRLGAISWDCSLPKNTYFGFHQIRSMSPGKYRATTPFYADILEEDRIDYHTRTQEEYDRELQYAIDAGLDYLAHVWYPDEGSRQHVQTGPSDCSGHVYELNWARRMHMSSPLKERLHFCAIAGAHPFTDRDLEALARGMQDPCYETLDGRPLLYVFAGCRADFNSRIRSVCEKLGFPAPYIAAMYSSGVEGFAPEHKQVDALSAYSCCGVGMQRYAQLSDLVMAQNENRRQAANHVIPLYTVGWDPSPRIDHPIPWYQYPDADYAALANRDELLSGAKALTDWLQTTAKAQWPGHILTFAWNEFEEGAHICPTVGTDGNPNCTRLEDFRAAADFFRKNLA